VNKNWLILIIVAVGAVLLINKAGATGSNVYMTFSDTSGESREINMTVDSAANGITIEELKQAYINGGFVFVSQRTGP